MDYKDTSYVDMFKDILAQKDRIKELEALLEDAVDCLYDMVCQHCAVPEHDKEWQLEHHGEVWNVLDSMALSANRDAMKLLAKLGKIEIVSEYGRRVLANWTRKELQDENDDKKA